MKLDIARFESRIFDALEIYDKMYQGLCCKDDEGWFGDSSRELQVKW